MSILIKGMEMPDRCFACPLCDVDGDGGVLCAISHGSYIEYKDVDEDIAIDHRPDDCPLIEVPPHGRLIDADALSQIHWNYAYKDNHNYGFHITAKAWIDAAPTIIPAEPPKEEI